MFSSNRKSTMNSHCFRFIEVSFKLIQSVLRSKETVQVCNV